MCFNAEMSMTLFIFGILTSIGYFMRHYKNLNQNTIIHVVLIAVVSFMQLNEYFIHVGYNEDGNCNEMGHLASYFVLVTLMLQIVILYLTLLIVYFYYKKSNVIFGKKFVVAPDGVQKVVLVMGLLVLIVFLSCLFVLLTNVKSEETCSKPEVCEYNGGCKLRWDVITILYDRKPAEMTTAYVLYFVMFLLVILFGFDLMLFITFLLSVLISFIYVYAFTNSGEYTFRADYFGSFWCVFSLLCSIVYGLIPIDKINFLGKP